MKNYKSCYKLITFDVTNTLLKFKIPVGEQYAKIALIYGIQRNPDQISAAFLKSWKTMNQLYPNYGCSFGMSSNAWWKKLVEKSFYSVNNRISSDQLENLSDHLFNLYKTSACWVVVPGAISLLEELKRTDIMLGVISNFDERLESVLNETALNKYFDFFLSSYVVRSAKPNREIFDLALSKSSVVASQALHVGDDVKLDYLAAKRAGWNAVLVLNMINQNDFLDNVASSDIIEDIAELQPYIFKK